MRGATSEIIRPALADRPSIHAPHAWGDSLYHGGWRSIDKLQSTPHMRGATVHCLIYRPLRCAFNPRPTCVGRLCVVHVQSSIALLQSTPHMRGATVFLQISKERNLLLQSTPHMRGATVKAAISDRKRATSIHVPHAWGDCNQPDGFLAFCTSIHAPHAWGDAMKIIDNALKN